MKHDAHSLIFFCIEFVLKLTTYCCLKVGSHIRIGVTKGVKTKLRRDDSDFQLKS